MRRLVRGSPLRLQLVVGLVLELAALPAGAAASRPGALGPDDVRWLDHVTDAEYAGPRTPAGG
jgi:hypothetical protein